MSTFPFPETFTIHTETVSGQDADGNDVYTPRDVCVEGAFAPAGSTELVQGQATVIEHDTIYLADGSTVPSATDTMTVRGTKRNIDGVPGVYRNPFTGRESGAVVRLVQVTG